LRSRRACAQQLRQRHAHGDVQTGSAHTGSDIEHNRAGTDGYRAK
jgi:hypothetical protein